MSNAWGALSWGQGQWAAQGDVDVSLSGISATYSIGSVTAEGIIQVGWGEILGVKTNGVIFQDHNLQLQEFKHHFQ